MHLDPRQLKSNLTSGLEQLYYVAGDETLLCEESSQAILNAATENGFDEIVRLDVASNDWSNVLLEADSTSLFADKRILDVRPTTNTLDRKGVAAVTAFVDSKPVDTILLIRGRTYEYRHRTTNWFKYLVAHGVVVIAEPISVNELPRWIEERSRSYRLNLTCDAVDRLADLSEGNLYAAKQELEKLSLLFVDSDQAISPDDLSALDWSIGNTFEMIDEACEGNHERATKLLDAVRRNGSSELMVLGALAAHLRRMHSISNGGQVRLPTRSLRSVRSAAKRLGQESIERLLVDCTHVDSQVKGILSGDPWTSILGVLLSIAGHYRSDLDAKVRWHTIDY